MGLTFAVHVFFFLFRFGFGFHFIFFFKNIDRREKAIWITNLDFVVTNRLMGGASVVCVIRIPKSTSLCVGRVREVRNVPARSFGSTYIIVADFWSIVTACPATWCRAVLLSQRRHPHPPHASNNGHIRPLRPGRNIIFRNISFFLAFFPLPVAGACKWELIFGQVEIVTSQAVWFIQ